MIAPPMDICFAGCGPRTWYELLFTPTTLAPLNPLMARRGPPMPQPTSSTCFLGRELSRSDTAAVGASPVACNNHTRMHGRQALALSALVRCSLRARKYSWRRMLSFKLSSLNRCAKWNESPLHSTAQHRACDGQVTGVEVGTRPQRWKREKDGRRELKRCPLHNRGHTQAPCGFSSPRLGW
jgi:hypothetical protein